MGKLHTVCEGAIEKLEQSEACSNDHLENIITGMWEQASGGVHIQDALKEGREGLPEERKVCMVVLRFRRIEEGG